MDQIISFNKTFHDRLTEYHVVFGNTKLSPIPEIKNQWSLYLELELEVSGWQAFWKIPRYMCSKNNIPYPTIVLVLVNEIKCEDLEASVEIIATQGDLNTNQMEHTASLLNLWPTKQQPNALDGVVDVANTLDKLRFFYNNVLMPWDYLDSGKCEGNLQERLHLYYNIKENVIPKNKTVKFRLMLKEIRDQFEYFDLINLKLGGTPDLTVKIIELKLEYELLQILPTGQDSNNNNNWLIFSTKSRIKDHIEYLASLKDLTIGKFQTAVTLESALNGAQPHDTIHVTPGKHVINSAGILKDSVCLTTRSSDPTKTAITTHKENTIIEFIGDKLRMENICLNVTRSRCAIITHCGEITLKNCVITGNQAAEHAIIVLPGAKVHLENCKITGFDVGLYASSNTVVSLSGCHFFGVASAVKLFDESSVCLFNCVFENVSCCCVCFESKYEGCQTGDETILNANPCVSIKECKFKDNPTIVVIKNKEDIFDTNI